MTTFETETRHFWRKSPLPLQAACTGLQRPRNVLRSRLLPQFLSETLSALHRGLAALRRDSCFMRARQRSRRVLREDVVASLDSFVTGKARVHYLFVG
jgi:hypothetical protein